MKVLHLLLIVLAFSCTPQQRLNRLIKKHPELWYKDSILYQDTIRISAVTKDTTFFYNQHDTTIIREGRLTMKYFYNTHDSTVYLSGKCDTIVRIIEKQIPYDKYNVEVNDNKWLIIVGGIIAVLLVLLLLRI